MATAANGIVDCAECNGHGCDECGNTGVRPAKAFKWTVEITVSEVWVADGFEITEERVRRMVEGEIGFAYPGEVRAKVVKSPDPAAVRKAQGYEG